MFQKDLQQQLQKERNPDISQAMSAYMKYKFPFLGIKSPLRKSILKPLLLFYKIELQNHAAGITKELYTLPEREYHYCAMELYAKFKKKYFEASDITTIKWLITTNSLGYGGLYSQTHLWTVAVGMP